MIRIDTHGRRWIMDNLGMRINQCPECEESLYINENKPQESKTENWFDCNCNKCGCEWTVKYEKEIQEAEY